MTTKEAAELIKNSNGFFTVTFKTRKTGDIRVMNARYGVEKYVKGVGALYDFDAHNLICVWDKHKKDYRSVPIEGIIELAINGEKHDIKK